MSWILHIIYRSFLGTASASQQRTSKFRYLSLKVLMGLMNISLPWAALFDWLYEFREHIAPVSSLLTQRFAAPVPGTHS